MKRDAVEHYDERTVFNLEAFDDVKLVEFAAPIGHIGQVPATRGSFPAHPSLVVEQSPALENAPNGAHTRHVLVAALDEGAMDGLGSIFAQIALLAQYLAGLAHKVFHVRGYALGWFVWTTGAVTPIDAIKPFALSAFKPALYGTQADAKAQRDRALRPAAAYSSDHIASFLFEGVFLLIAVTS